ncbi:MAG TPA: bifunctional glutamate N-acetyltransferase/amino-acid acetyltransferase ArgJ [Desulfurivibrio alkaliphilus]|uniref:Arginine biosynthesis bifunctional protein ArgJ n=1 Tax=Desulfurivibrio alkaliphilus TaxID=427923 RepID=A0A7C2XR83_9BACT|nr:bifunctional glutamate N-acetyltransferase/amino-acid acetyltransferase ArgJ [Desulfurivibrio alkaliphilus]
MTLAVRGFRAAAVKSGIRGKDRLDLGLIVSERPAAAAGVFTTNTVKAAPVLLGASRLKGGRAQAILVNSGIANACTGEEGMRNARLCGAMLADNLGIEEELVQLSSTGVIGMQLDVECFRGAIPRLAAGLRDDSAGLEAVGRAIMTTDTVPKSAVRSFELDGVEVRITGLAKGAGMIMPDMATMLCFILTDAAVDPDLLRRMLRRGVEASFNRITIDGDTSTNDTVLLLANGSSGAAPLAEGSPAQMLFEERLRSLCLDLARQVVRDGEGASKLVTIRVEGAVDEAQARQAARTIANSSLVKTAFFGEDANWGRIIAALGRSGATFDQNAVSIAFDGVVMVKDGVGQGAEVEARATAVLKQPEFTVTVDLRAGSAATNYLTCDFSIDYVKINADYRT